VGDEDEDNVIADRDIRDVRPDRFDDASRLVSQGYRNRAGPVAVDDREIRVADAGGFDRDEQFAGTGWAQFERLYLERRGAGVRRRRPYGVQYHGSGRQGFAGHGTDPNAE
jgi:hypothetical protein